MKTLIVVLVLLSSITLSAKDLKQTFALALTDVETSNSETSTALSLKVKQDPKDCFNFIISYVSDILNVRPVQEPSKVQNQQMQNIYVAFNYRY